MGFNPGFDPTKEFYLVATVDMADGTFSPPDADSNASFMTLDDARRHMAADYAEFGCQLLLFRCVPIERTAEDVEKPDDPR